MGHNGWETARADQAVVVLALGLTRADERQAVKVAAGDPRRAGQPADLDPSRTRGGQVSGQTALRECLGRPAQGHDERGQGG